MSDFPHLNLPYKIQGVVPPKQNKINPNTLTIQNKNNRLLHGQYLRDAANKIIDNWKKKLVERSKASLESPNSKDIPVFLKIDTKAFNIDSLLQWGIEFISEEEEGYIIGASVDDLQAFQNKVDKFINEEGKYKNTAAKIWELVTDNTWRLNQLLEGEIANRWEKIIDLETYTIEIGVSCSVSNTKKFPNRNGFESDEAYQMKVEEFKAHERKLQLDRDTKQLQREEEIDKYIRIYNGVLHDIWDNNVDVIHFKLSINGKGIRDIVHNYQYLYKVKFDTTYNINTDTEDFIGEYEAEIIGPMSTATKVCVIDSGIQESHRLIEKAIDVSKSRSYVEDDASTADYVKRSGHGTKVAGAILYPYFIPKNGQFQLETIIQNARILNKDNRISSNNFAPSLMERIVQDYSGTRIFNLSVADDDAYNGTHMPPLAASIDKLSYENDILFVIAAGNLFKSCDNAINPGIKEYLALGNLYPDYLNNDSTKVANPGVCLFGITVGSISKAHFEDEDYKSIAGENYISSFSRTGLGMWGSIKPDVVEFGGDYAINKTSLELITNDTIAPELVSSTMYGSRAVNKDTCGTSFSAPKVSYIASRLQAEHPNESAQMYRALIIQSARLPEHCFNNPTLNDFRYYGYGVPDVNRALNNSPNRITFIQSGKIGPRKANIYRINIPSELRGERDFQILIEVTLAFTAKTRLTRKGAHSYLSNWLEWQSSKLNESFSSFKTRTIQYLELDEDTIEEGTVEEGLNSIKWSLRENPAWSSNRINRNNSTVQKSWVIIEPYQFAEEFSLAVIGHIGWDKNLENETSYALCVSFEAVGSEIPVYNLLAQAQIEIQPEQAIEI